MKSVTVSVGVELLNGNTVEEVRGMYKQLAITVVHAGERKPENVLDCESKFCIKFAQQVSSSCITQIVHSSDDLAMSN